MGHPVHVALLPNIEGFPSASMVRYATELEIALRRAGGSQWTWETLHVRPREGMSARWASRIGRWIDYPRLASHTRADVYHVLDHSHANLTNAVPASRVVLTCHDIIPYLAALGKIPMASGRATRLTYPARLKAMRRCRRVIADSEATRQDLLSYGHLSPEQVVVAYPGVGDVFSPLPDDAAESARRRTALRARYQLPPDTPLILQVATPTRYKNTPAVLHALHTLAQQSSLRGRVRLLRVGAPFFDDEESLIENLGIREQIVFVGRVATDMDLAEHYRCADAFAFPSLWEGFGWPPLEAMACGLVPVVSNVASLPEVVGNAGLQVAPRDKEALASALCELLTDPASRTVRSGACVLQAQKFSWENCAQSVLEVYRQVVA